MTNRLGQLMREGKPAAGFWMNLSDPAIARIAALSGYDWIMIDTEHNPLTESQVESILLALCGLDATPVVRVRGTEQCHITWVLDAGAGGIICPGIKDSAEAKRAVEISKYSPLGTRGFGPNRASDFWVRGEEYVASANRQVLTICQVELESAVQEIDPICDIPGLDGIWIGPGDLAQSLGHLGNTGHPEVQEAICTVIEAAGRHRIPWGIPTAQVEDYEKYVGLGGTIMTLGSDTRMLRAAASEFIRRVKGA